MRMRRHLPKLGAALTAGCLVAAVGYAASASGAEREVLGPGVVTIEVRIQHSTFDLGSPVVREGTILQFVVQNDDPIDHEFLVGDDGLHLRHSQGTEQRHPPVPGEVSVAPGATAMTFYEFTSPGRVTYACHLPGHVAYGMTGTIEVVPA